MGLVAGWALSSEVSRSLSGCGASPVAASLCRARALGPAGFSRSLECCTGRGGAQA